MKSETKNIIKDLKAGRNLGANVRRYSEILSTAFTNYAAVKLSLNLFRVRNRLLLTFPCPHLSRSAISATGAR